MSREYFVRAVQPAIDQISSFRDCVLVCRIRILNKLVNKLSLRYVEVQMYSRTARLSGDFFCTERSQPMEWSGPRHIENGLRVVVSPALRL